MTESIKSISDQLVKKGIRPSYQRIRVLEYLHQKKGHPTVDEIFNSLSPDIPSLSKTTVYNILHILVEEGLVRIVSVDRVETRFDIMLDNHGHFKCDACGAISNFEIDIDSIPFSDLNHFEIKEKNVYFNGLCPNCINRKNRKKE
jgi:Fur family transcriptional regulator, peroxide stress response regulator